MSVPRTRRRWLEMLRRTAGVDVPEPRPALDDAALWSARDRAAAGALDAERVAERLAAAAARQRAQLDGIVERAAHAGTRAAAGSATLARLRETLDRLGIVALNAGLEGARGADGTGRGLALVATEIQAQVARGLEALREATALFEETTQGALDLSERLERVQREVAEVVSDAAQLKSGAQEVRAGLADLEARLRKATGLDPETARLLAQAGEHAKGLVAALSALETASASAASKALAPLLAPLNKLVAAIPLDDEPSSDDSPGAS